MPLSGNKYFLLQFLEFFYTKCLVYVKQCIHTQESYFDFTDDVQNTFFVINIVKFISGMERSFPRENSKNRHRTIIKTKRRGKFFPVRF